jgi:hypothetical protein
LLDDDKEIDMRSRHRPVTSALRPDGLFSIVDPMSRTITGGTGGFLHATGEGTAVALGNIRTSTTAGTWTGTIQYDASDRANN